jgi:predicted dehydrogenase
MRLLWNGDWIETPAPTPVAGGVRLEVEAAIPIAKVAVPSGRVIRSPYRKAVRFLTLDGPGDTLRKVRSKREEARLLDDYRIVAILGTRDDTSGSEATPALGLALRAAPCAQMLLCHEDLVFEAPAGEPATLSRFVDGLRPHTAELVALATQSYLYSGESPPSALRDLAREAAASAAGLRTDPANGLGRAQADDAEIRPPHGGDRSTVRIRLRPERSGYEGGVPVALLGAGDYARTQIIPVLQGARFLAHTVSDREPQIAAEVGRAAKFSHATTDSRTAIESLPRPGLVVIATAHDSHAELAATALDAGHRVFVEKPPIVSAEDLAMLEEAVARSPFQLEVGFNRRHHPLTAKLHSALGEAEGPLTITCLVREISISPSHWYFWPNQGTRVAGNLCHWIDLGLALVGPDAHPVEVAVSPPPPIVSNGAPDSERVVSVTFDDGSLLNVVATDRGDDLRGVQESIEARRGLVTARIDDFRSLTVLRDGRARTTRRAWRTKGHREMFEGAFERAARNEPAAYAVDDLVRVSRIQILASQLLEHGGSAPLAQAAGARG